LHLLLTKGGYLCIETGRLAFVQIQKQTPPTWNRRLQPERYQGKAGEGPAMTNDIEFLAALSRLTINMVFLTLGALTIAAANCIAINWREWRGRSAPEIKNCRCTPCQWPDCRHYCVGPD
jgi:hypothetical protein